MVQVVDDQAPWSRHFMPPEHTNWWQGQGRVALLGRLWCQIYPDEAAPFVGGQHWQPVWAVAEELAEQARPPRGRSTNFGQLVTTEGAGHLRATQLDAAMALLRNGNAAALLRTVQPRRHPAIW